MEEKLGDLIQSLQDLVERLGDTFTADDIENTRKSDPDDGFDNPFARLKKEQQQQADETAKSNIKAQEKYDKKKEKDRGPRKILKTIMPVSIMDIDNKVLEKLGDVISREKVSKDKAEAAEDDNMFSGLGLLKGLAYGAFALVVGTATTFFAFFDEIKKQKWFIDLAKFVKSKFWEPIQKLLQPVKNLFTKLFTSGPAKRILSVVDDIWQGVKTFGGKIKALLEPITRMFSGIGKLFGGAGKGAGLFAKIASFFNPAKNPVIKGVLGFSSKLGSVLGKIFLPITILTQAFNFITGFMDGYDQGGIIGGLRQGVTDVFNSLIGWPLDILKSGVSWILGAFGFEDAEAILDAFSFRDMFAKIFDSLFGSIDRVVERVGFAITDLFDGNLAGAMEGVTAAVGQLVAYPLDLLKGSVSWILGAFGLEDAEKTLDAFSFSEMFDEVVMHVFSYVENVFESVGKIFTNFMNGDWIKGLSGIGNLIIDVIALPYDLLKDAVSWVVSMFGFEQASAQLDGFSFSDLYKNIIDNVWSYVQDIFGSVGEIFDDFMSGDWSKGLSGVGDLILDVVALPYNLVKDAVSWVLGMFGFEQASTVLDSFDFSVLFSNIVSGIFDFFKSGVDWLLLLFSEPEKAFKKIGDWFNSLFKDPLGTIKKMVPDWMKDFGGWVYDMAIKPIADFFGGVVDKPEVAKGKMMSYLPDWMKNFGGWVFDSFIMPVANYFDKLLSGDITGAFAALVPQWMKDFGGWLYDETIGRVVSFFTSVENDSEGMKTRFIDMLPSWMTGMGEWIWDNSIKPISDFMNNLFDDPLSALDSLIPDWLRDLGGWLYNNTIKPVADLFQSLLDIDFVQVAKDQIKSIPVVGEKIYNTIWGDEKQFEQAAKATDAANKMVAEVSGLQDTNYAELMRQQNAEIGEKFGGEAYADRMSDVMDSIEDAIESGEGDWKKVQQSLEKSGDLSAILKTMNVDTKNETAVQGLMKQLAAGYTDQWGPDDINRQGEALMANIGNMVAGRELGEAKQKAAIDTLTQTIQKQGVTLGGQKITSVQLQTGDMQVSQSMIDEYKSLQQKQTTMKEGADKVALGQYLQALKNVGVDNAVQQATPLPSTNYKLPQADVNTPDMRTPGLSQQIPDINTDSAAADIRKAGDSINTGAQLINQAAGEKFPPPNSPYAWEYLKMAGDNINTGSRMLYNQSVEYKRAAENAGKETKSNNKEMNTKMDRMVEILAETSETQKKTLEVLQQHGLIDKQGNTVVNSGGNTTNVNNVTVESDIMSFRDRVVGRLNNK